MSSKISYPKIANDRELYLELKKRVKERVQNLPDKRQWYLQAKAFIFPLIYFSCYLTALFFGVAHPSLYLGMYLLMGLTIVLIYLNVIHEAAHFNVFKKRKYNEWTLRIFDLIGANSYIWRKRHIVSHHAYPNVDGWDTDMEQSGAIKIFPHTKAHGAQKFQHLYVPFIYPLYLFNWVLLRDPRDFFSKNRIIYKVHGPAPKKEKIKLVLFKLFYFFYQIAVPILFFKASFGLAFGAWALQAFVASIFALFVLLPLHPLPDNAFPLPDEKEQLPYSWMRHQFEVTNDLTHNNWFIRHILGNFNFHVAHHLFPQYSYAVYNEVTDEIVKFANEHQMPYKKFTLLKALGKHYELLKLNAHDAPLHHVFEELDS